MDELGELGKLAELGEWGELYELDELGELDDSFDIICITLFKQLRGGIIFFFLEKLRNSGDFGDFVVFL